MITELNKQEFYKVRYITDQCNNIEVTAAIIWTRGQGGFHNNSSLHITNT
jgi:hypothetical protein